MAPFSPTGASESHVMDSLHAHAPFHPPRAERDWTALEVDGELPAWLRGRLLRTCPAKFEHGSWRASHLFDGLGMIYGFEIRDGAVRYANRYLRTRQWARVHEGRGWASSFADGPQRSPLRRLFQPIPPITDNANVNLCRVGDDLVAMTETQHQVRFDPATLRTLGPKRYDDDLDPRTMMIAHPHFEPQTRSVLGVAFQFGRKARLMLYRVGSDGRRREVIASRESSTLPYMHDFGMTEHHALLVLHPWNLDPRRLLWSNRGIVDHFEWDPSASTSIAIIDRRTGEWREVEVPGAPFFMFHAANAFEREDGELVLDVLAYPDVGIVDGLRIDSLLEGFVDLHAHIDRITISADRRSVRRERVVDAPFEFPIVDYRRRNARDYRWCWGADNRGTDQDSWVGEVLKVDVRHGSVVRHAVPGKNVGEPVFVPADPTNRDAAAEDDGVLLCVASDLFDDQAELLVLDARSLEPVARAPVGDGIPIGFHGQFFPDRGAP